MPLSSHRIVSPGGATSAELIPAAGMLCASLTHDGEELLDPGKGLEAYAERGATMGIPLLYPWANRLAGLGYDAAGAAVALPDDRSRVPQDPGGLPIHGVIPGMMRWEVQDGADETTLTARLGWRAPELLELYPYPHEAVMEVVAGDGALTLSTTVHADVGSAGGAGGVPISFGFHPYLRLPAGDRSGWRVTLPAMERLALDARMIPTGERTPLADEERNFELADSSWDDGFAGLAQPAHFAVAAGGWEITVEHLEGYPFSQIYAPPGHDFICFEPMTAPANALVSGDGLTVIAPDDTYRAAFRVAVRHR